MSVEITQKGAGEAAKMITELAERALDPRPAFARATDLLTLAEKRRFASLGRTKEATRESKARDTDPRVREHATQAGVASGELERFMTTTGRRAQPAKMTKNVLVFGVPGGHKLTARAAGLAKIGKNPLVSRAVARRYVTQALSEYLAGDLGAARSAKWWRR